MNSRIGTGNMKKKQLFPVTLLLLGIATFVIAAFKFSEEKQVLKPGDTISLPGVKGRIDHLQFDAAGQRVFICALGNGSVEVIDLNKKTVAGSIRNLQSPQGIIFVPEKKKLFVACGGDGFVRVFDSEKLTLLDSVYIGNDADNMRLDSLQQRIYVASDNGMTIIGLNDLKIIKNIDLEGHPESFQIDRVTRRMFVNVPDAHEIEVIDMKSNIVSERWSLVDAKENFPMAVDEKQHRLFVACRQPAKIIVMDDQTGNVLSAVGCSGDADDLFYDAATQQILISCGQGFIDVFNDKGQNTFTQTAHVASRLLARTSFYVPAEKKFFLALPADLAYGAELRTYTLIP
jgi:DNA-binding beta-propeller fold protein YncE